MFGMNQTTGRRISDMDHLRQSIRDVLSTPIGSRVMRRDYGSLLPELLDKPLNEATLLRAYAASILAIINWEPRLRIVAIRRRLSSNMPGRATLEIEGETRSGNPVRMEVVL